MTAHKGVVEVAGLRHSYRVGKVEVPALDRVDLTIRPGEFVTLAGPSGCGKTTLLRLLAGFTRPSEGAVTVGGNPVTTPGAERGVVFQSPNLFPWLTVRGNIELGPRLRRVPKAERDGIVARQLELVGLTDFADHRPYQLSGGMQQRCQIARVLANDPGIVLMDEPFGALDAMTRERMQEELLQIWRATGRTIVFITHSVDEAVFLGSRVLVMSPRPGRIVLDEPAVFVDDGERVPADVVRSLPQFVELRDTIRSAIRADVRTAIRA